MSEREVILSEVGLVADIIREYQRCAAQRDALVAACERARWVLANCVGAQPPANWAALRTDADRAYEEMTAALAQAHGGGAPP